MNIKRLYILIILLFTLYFPLPLLARPELHTYNMLDYYTNFDKRNGVVYLSQDELSKYEVYVKDGRLYDYKNLLVDTDLGIEMIYVISPEGKMYMGKATTHVFHHSSFLAGRPVAAAGTIFVDEGVIEEITNESGHYQPPKRSIYEAAQYFKDRGVDLERINFYDPINDYIDLEEIDEALNLNWKDSKAVEGFQTKYKHTETQYTDYLLEQSKNKKHKLGTSERFCLKKMFFSLFR